MSKSNTFENDFLKLIYNADAIANIADNAGSAPLSSLFVAVHTADPGEAGDQTTNEAAYTGYNRVALGRDSGGFTVAGNQVTPVAEIAFGQCTTSPGNNLTHFSVGVASSGASKILHSGAINPEIVMGVGVTPTLTTGTVITED